MGLLDMLEPIYSALPEGIGDLVSPGRSGGKGCNTNQVDFLIETEGTDTFVRNRDLNIIRSIGCNQAQIERREISLCLQGIGEALLEKVDVGRIDGIIWVDQVNSHFP